MTIGTALHHTLAQKHFTRLDTDISSLQAQIASGEADPRASVDPVRALNMSAAQDQQSLLEQFSLNLETIDRRLSLSDTTLEEVGNILERFSELAIRGATASVTDDERESMRIEAIELRNNLVQLAQSRDDNGRALFGGYQTKGDAFNVDGGNVEYIGDTGRHSLRVSENTMLPTSLHGQEIFMDIEIEGPGGPVVRDIFSIVDDVLNSLTLGGGSRLDTVSASEELRFKPNGVAGPITMTIEGPSGTATISAPYMASSPQALLDAINAASATTGITAIIDPSDPTALRLSGGEMSLSDLQIGGGGARDTKRVVVTPITGGVEGDRMVFIPESMTVGAQIDAISAGINHMANMRAEIGAIQQVGERQSSALDNRLEMVERALAGYEGIDIAAAITELQALMLNREAAQQTYTKISTQTLFDFIG